MGSLLKSYWKWGRNMNIDIDNRINKINDFNIEDEVTRYVPKKLTLKEMIVNVLRHILLIFVSIITFFPFIWMISSALKTKEENLIKNVFKGKLKYIYLTAFLLQLLK